MHPSLRLGSVDVSGYLFVIWTWLVGSRNRFMCAVVRTPVESKAHRYISARPTGLSAGHL